MRSASLPAPASAPAPHQAVESITRWKDLEPWPWCGAVQKVEALRGSRLAMDSCHSVVPPVSQRRGLGQEGRGQGPDTCPQQGQRLWAAQRLPEAPRGSDRMGVGLSPPLTAAQEPEPRGGHPPSRQGGRPPGRWGDGGGGGPAPTPQPQEGQLQWDAG